MQLPEEPSAVKSSAELQVVVNSLSGGWDVNLGPLKMAPSCWASLQTLWRVMGSAKGLFLPRSTPPVWGTVADTDLQSHQSAKEAKAASLGYTVRVFKTMQNKVNTIFFFFTSQKPLGKIL